MRYNCKYALQLRICAIMRICATIANMRYNCKNAHTIANMRYNYQYALQLRIRNYCEYSIALRICDATSLNLVKLLFFALPDDDQPAQPDIAIPNDQGVQEVQVEVRDGAGNQVQVEVRDGATNQTEVEVRDGAANTPEQQQFRRSPRTTKGIPPKRLG
jgi:hypothetical protein